MASSRPSPTSAALQASCRLIALIAVAWPHRLIGKRQAATQ